MVLKNNEYKDNDLKGSPETTFRYFMVDTGAIDDIYPETHHLKPPFVILR